MIATNDIDFLVTTCKRFEDAGIRAFVFGGWAEELQGMIEPKRHKDIDLLYPAVDFNIVDEFIAKNDITEIPAKHSPLGRIKWPFSA